MSVKVFDIDGIGPVKLQKRRGNRHMRITISGNGTIRVSLPPWAPYRLGLEYAKNKQDWIIKHRSEPKLLREGQVIGKAHRLKFVISNNAKQANSRIVENEIRISFAAASTITDSKVQQAAQRGSLKALKKEAEHLLPNRLKDLAQKHGFKYQSVRIKHLKSKWGSCTNKSEITLNSFLMTLPWDLIDYVLLHELLHTKILRHGDPFWSAFQEFLPDVQARRKALKSFSTQFG